MLVCMFLLIGVCGAVQFDNDDLRWVHTLLMNFWLTLLDIIWITGPEISNTVFVSSDSLPGKESSSADRRMGQSNRIIVKYFLLHRVGRFKLYCP